MARRAHTVPGMGARTAVAWAAALWAGLALGVSLPLAAACLVLLLGVWVVWAPVSVRRPSAAVVVAVGLGLLGMARAASSEHLHAARLGRLPELPAVVRLVGTVAEPARRGGDAPSVLIEVHASAPALPQRTRLRLRLPPECPAEWADTLDVLARLTPLRGPRGPGGFDAREAARASGVLASGRAFTARVRAARGARSALLRAAMRVRRAGERVLAHALSPGARELAAPLVFGDRSGMSTDTDAALRGSGLVHLLALSGLHVAWLAGVARVLMAALGGGIAARAWAGALAALGYALVAGPIPSLARAVAAEAATALARLSGRALDPLQSLAVAILALLAWQPAWGRDLGFQLSCAATLGLVAIGGPLAHDTARAPRLLRGLAAALAATLGAQLAAMPLLLARFHALSWTSLAGNLVAVPVSEGLLAAAGLGVLAELALPGTGGVWLAACEPLAAALQWLTRAGGAWPGALLATGAHALPVALAAVGATALAVGLGRRSARAPALVFTGALASGLALLLAGAASELRPPPDRWWLVVVDVGQGDALAVGTHDGWWLVDTGPRSPRWDAGESAVAPFFRWARVRALRALVLTHDDGDHTGGEAAVRRALRVRARLGPAPRAGVPGPCARLALTPLARGDTLALAPGVRVLWPPREGEPGCDVAARGDNAASLVLELGGEGARALLTADADSMVEAELRVRTAPALLKAGHHGSGSSSGAQFVVRLAPRHAAISCGVDNPYGHPAAGALERLAASGACIARTDRDGALWYEFDARRATRLDLRRGSPWLAGWRRARAAGAAAAPRAP